MSTATIEPTIASLQEQVDSQARRIAELEKRLAPVIQFMNNKFGATIQSQPPQYNEPNDRSETGMGPILSADRSSFI